MQAQALSRTPYPSDVSDDEWALVRLAHGRPADPSAAVLDGRTLQSTLESGHRASYDGYKWKKGSKVHLAVDTLGNLLAVHITAGREQERAHVHNLAVGCLLLGKIVQLYASPQQLLDDGGLDEDTSGNLHKREGVRQSLRAGAPGIR